MTEHRFFLPVLGKTYAILNAPLRRGPEDVVCLRGLTDEEQVRLEQRRARGDPDEAIFLELFPKAARDRPRPAVDLGRLRKKQIADMLRSFVGEPLPSLEGATKADLQSICRFLLRADSS